MSKDWISGTPPASWSRAGGEDGDVLLLDRHRAQRRFTLLTITPWRRRLALTMAYATGSHLATDGLSVLVLAFHSDDDSLTALRRGTIAVFKEISVASVCFSLVTEISSSVSYAGGP